MSPKEENAARIEKVLEVIEEWLWGIAELRATAHMGHPDAHAVQSEILARKRKGLANAIIEADEGA